MESTENTFTYTKRAFDDGHLCLQATGKTEKIVYVAVDRAEKWSDPEEKVRAEFYAQLIYEYGYSPKRIGVEITVPDRTPNDFADLIVFEDDEHKRPYAVIECKKDGISDAEFSQAVEQAWGNGNAHRFRAKFVGVVAGATRKFLDCDEEKFGARERDSNVVADLPKNYKKPPEWKYAKESTKYRDIRPVSKGELIAAIKKCHQTLWGGGRLSPPAAFGEFCKVIFVKVRDEKTCKPKSRYKFQIKSEEEAKDLATRIKKLYDKEREKEPDVFKDPIKVDDGTLKMCVQHLEGINFSKTDLDTKGVAFEQFLDGFFKGDFGQYFTPREIIQFCVEMLDPQNDQRVLDPACGSGGFLLYAMDHVRHEAGRMFPDYETDVDQSRQWHDHWHTFAATKLFGIEINDEISRVAKMNMILHDDGHTNVIGHDALEKFAKFTDLTTGLKESSFDLILTNPPFGATIKESEKGSAYMEDWGLLRLTGKAKKSIKTEILFCERVYQFLKPDTGKAAIVLPDGILTNSSLQGVRDWLINHFRIKAVVSLPQEAFQHAGAAVKASVVFVERRAKGEVPDDNEAIFMATPTNIGYDSTGRKTYEHIIGKAKKGIRKDIHRTDLFDLEVNMIKAPMPGTGEEEWQERGRRVLPKTGILGQFRKFERNPDPFFA